MAQIASIVYTPREQGKSYDRSGRFLRVPLEEANLIAGHGLEGDFKAGRSPHRQLNLLSTAWVAEMTERGYQTRPGELGEQLTIDGLDFDAVEPGDRIALGDAAVIEITKPRTGCERLDAAQDGPSPLAGKEIGLLAKVVRGGAIRVGDPVQAVEKIAA